MKSPAERTMQQPWDKRGRPIFVTDKVQWGRIALCSGIVESIDYGFSDCVNVREDGTGRLRAFEPDALEVVG